MDFSYQRLMTHGFLKSWILLAYVRPTVEFRVAGQNHHGGLASRSSSAVWSSPNSFDLIINTG